MGGYAVKYLLDTSVWLRSATHPETIPAAVRDLLKSEDHGFSLSAISLWEVGKKSQRGKLKLAGDLLTWFKTALPSSLDLLPITPEIVAAAMSLEQFPNQDPADELIVGTARVHQLILLTTDTALKNYPHVKIHYFTPLLEK
jgi:PIN domain nuclease of toxin-antitoxin system